MLSLNHFCRQLEQMLFQTLGGNERLEVLLLPAQACFTSNAAYLTTGTDNNAKRAWSSTIHAAVGFVMLQVLIRDCTPHLVIENPHLS